MGIKIEGWSVRDFRNLEFINMKVKDYILKVSGKNGSGKSSAINAIFMAMLGPKYAGKNPQRMIKTGKDKAIITVHLKDGDRELEVERTISKTGMRLKAKTSDGLNITQEYLDGLINLTMIDPLSWANSKPKEQIKDLKNKAGIDTSKLEEEYNDVFKERTFQNREVKKLTGAVNTFKDIDIPEKIISLADAHEAKNQAVAKNSQAEISNNKNAYTMQQIKKLEDSNAKMMKEIKKLNAEIKRADKEKDKLLKETEKYVEIPIEDLNKYDADILVAEDIQKKMVMKNEQEKAKNELTKAKEVSDNLTKKLDDIKTEIKNVILRAKLPFDNIRFDNELGVVISDIPLSEHSTAEQIKIAIKINSKFAPHLKVIYIKDGSLLDKNTLMELEKLSIAEEFLFLVELVEEQDNSIIMRSGHIVEQG